MDTWITINMGIEQIQGFFFQELSSNLWNPWEIQSQSVTWWHPRRITCGKYSCTC